MKQPGSLRYADFRRDDDAFLRRTPETVRQILEAKQRMREGKGAPATLDEIRAMLGLAQ